jgi:hypothetical protein
MGVTACRPEADPSILIHRDPRAWEGLLGRCADAFMEEGGDVVEDLQSPAELRRAVRRADSAGRVTCWT